MTNRGTASTPVMFSTPLMALGERQTVIPDMALMSSRMRRPMWVDEVRFSYMFNAVVAVNLGYSLRCSLKLGRIAITSTRGGGNHVPIWNFGPPNHHAGLNENYHSINALGVGVGTTTGHFRWKLPQPLYLPAGQSLTPEIFRSADGFGGTAYVGIAVVGRDLGDIAQPMPDKILVPYVAYYQPPSGQTSAISSELDIVNPFQVPLAVQRFIGRQLQVDTGAVTAGEFTINDVFPAATINTTDIANIAIKDSYGQNVVRDIIPMGDVFDALQRGWVFQRILQPKERFVMQLSSIYASGAVTTTPMISMIGYREEALR